MQLIQSQQITMTSRELLGLVNQARLDAGEKPIRNADFLEKVQDELEGEHYGKTVVQNLNSTETVILELTVDQCTLVGMRESKSVRRQVIAKLKELSEASAPVVQIPDFSNPAAAARAWAEQFEARQIAEQTKAEIGSRREATAMNTASQAVRKANSLEQQLDKAKEYCSIKRMSLIHHGQPFDWRALKSASAEMGIPPVDVFDQNYGSVKAYHVSVWAEVYSLGIDQ